MTTIEAIYTAIKILCKWNLNWQYSSELPTSKLHLVRLPSDESYICYFFSCSIEWCGYSL